jgi:hypothetical protein
MHNESPCGTAVAVLCINLDFRAARKLRIFRCKSATFSSKPVYRVRSRLPKGGRRSLRAISDELAKAGHMTATGKPFAATAVKLMLATGLTEGRWCARRVAALWGVHREIINPTPPPHHGAGASARYLGWPRAIRPNFALGMARLGRYHPARNNECTGPVLPIWRGFRRFCARSGKRGQSPRNRRSARQQWPVSVQARGCAVARFA